MVLQIADFGKCRKSPHTPWKRWPNACKLISDCSTIFLSGVSSRVAGDRRTSVQRLSMWFSVYYTRDKKTIKLLNCNIHGRLCFMVLWRVLLCFTVHFLSNATTQKYQQMLFEWDSYVFFSPFFNTELFCLKPLFYVWPHISKRNSKT